jgi:hypothetical protein
MLISYSPYCFLFQQHVHGYLGARHVYGMIATVSQSKSSKAGIPPQSSVLCTYPHTARCYCANTGRFRCRVTLGLMQSPGPDGSGSDCTKHVPPQSRSRTLWIWRAGTYICTLGGHRAGIVVQSGYLRTTLAGVLPGISNNLATSCALRHI